MDPPKDEYSIKEMITHLVNWNQVLSEMILRRTMTFCEEKPVVANIC
jgi:hypothetical protein